MFISKSISSILLSASFLAVSTVAKPIPLYTTQITNLKETIDTGASVVRTPQYMAREAEVIDCFDTDSNVIRSPQCADIIDTDANVIRKPQKKARATGQDNMGV
ncbi:hypothetical protein V8F20_007111 [Naviculisporaceae sp. PSN 640]